MSSAPTMRRQALPRVLTICLSSFVPRRMAFCLKYDVLMGSHSKRVECSSGGVVWLADIVVRSRPSDAWISWYGCGLH